MITVMTACFLPFVLKSCASYIWVCVGGGGQLQEIKLLMDKFSQVKGTGLISKAHEIAGRLEKQPSRGHDWGAWGARKQQLWERLLGRNMWARLLGSAYPCPVSSPALRFPGVSQEWIWLSLGHGASSWLEGVMRSKICFFSSFHWKQAPEFHVAAHPQMSGYRLCHRRKLKPERSIGN